MDAGEFGQYSGAAAAGQTVGDVLSLVQGVAMFLQGGATATGGGALEVTGIGTVPGAAAVAVGSVESAHGAGVFVTAWSRLFFSGDGDGPVDDGGGSGDIRSQVPKKIHEGKQGKHVEGHNNYRSNKKSTLTADPQELLDGFHSGEYPAIRARENKVTVDFGKEIGIFKGENGSSPSQYGTIHFGKKDAHIVPANPNQY